MNWMYYSDSAEFVSSTTSNLGNSELLEFSLELSEFSWEVFFSLGSEFIDLDWLIHLFYVCVCVLIILVLWVFIFLYSILVCFGPSPDDSFHPFSKSRPHLIYLTLFNFTLKIYSSIYTNMQLNLSVCFVSLGIF